MPSRYRFLVFSLILVFYSFLYIATRKEPPCENDCPKIQAVAATLTAGYTYIYGINRCENQPTGLCVFVMDTPGVDWNHLADTTCFLAKQQNLYAQQVLILKNGSYPYDTLGRAQCP
jgi:hypothetical protein